nr:MAG TPA: hypothetical protein [Caudoviricetes sp.]
MLDPVPLTTFTNSFFILEVANKSVFNVYLPFLVSDVRCNTLSPLSVFNI